VSASVDPDVYVGLLQHFARYFDACDRCDIDEVMTIMAGAAVGVGDSALSDPAVIREMYASRQEPPLPDGRRVTKHHITNLLVEGPDPDGVYEATVYYFRLQPSDAGPVVAASGRLREVVRRDGDRWRVLGHSIVSDF
jgi:ketosteroid isomerase-like protein